ncbi:MAG: hypothetical protein ACKKL4_00820 [Patescibacteria group bacterium]
MTNESFKNNNEISKEKHAYSLNDLEQYGQMIFNNLAPTGALDEEWGHINGYLAQARRNIISPQEARERIDTYLKKRSSYH